MRAEISAFSARRRARSLGSKEASRVDGGDIGGNGGGGRALLFLGRLNVSRPERAQEGEDNPRCQQRLHGKLGEGDERHSCRDEEGRDEGGLAPISLSRVLELLASHAMRGRHVVFETIAFFNSVPLFLLSQSFPCAAPTSQVSWGSAEKLEGAQRRV